MSLFRFLKIIFVIIKYRLDEFKISLLLIPLVFLYIYLLMSIHIDIFNKIFNISEF